jgi:2-aminoadipate transaminase
MVDPYSLLTPRSQRLRDRQRRVLAQQSTGPRTSFKYRLDQGVPAPETYPMELLWELGSRVMSQHGPVAFDYMDPSEGPDEMTLGYTGLRRLIATRISERDGRDIAPAGVILTPGDTHGIWLAISAYLGPGEAGIVEESTYPHPVTYMTATGASVVRIPLRSDGMDLDVLGEQLHALAAANVRPKLIYTIPTFNLATGIVMSVESRRRLLQIAREWSLVVIEDNIYAPIRYAGAPLPTLLSLDESGLVLQADSFSKAIAPGIRLGWVAGTTEAIAGLGAVRSDLGVSQFMSRVMYEYLVEDHLAPHLGRVVPLYRERRDAAVAGLRRHCGDLVSFDVPDGGFYLWVNVSEATNLDSALQQAGREGVLVRSGRSFLAEDDMRQVIRFGFACEPVDRLWAATEVLGRALRGAAGQ